jgi:arylsulfatase A-like enzyme
VNLVIIVSDTFRWDYLGAYGNDWIKTPNLDRLAAESAVFVDAYAEALPTIPVRRVLVTGRPAFPFVYRPQPSDQVQLHGWHPLYVEDVALAEHLREHGYVSAFVTDVYHMMKPGKNFHRGYDHWYWVRGQEGDPYALRDAAQVQELLDQASYGQQFRDRPWIIQHLMNRKDWESDADTSVGQCMIHAARWIKQYTLDDPFFLYVDCFDPHEPWDPPLEYAQVYDPDYSGMDGCIPPGMTTNMTNQQVQNVKTAYAAEVTLVDRWVGHLLRTLEETRKLDDTLIVFTSDHGCMMGEQGEIHKGVTRLRNQCTRLPLFIRHPAGEGAGQQITGFVQHQDIMPTALALMGLDRPQRVLGADVWPMVAEGAPAPRDTAVSAFGQYACVRTAEWNYVAAWTDERAAPQQPPQLYDLKADPAELTNVIADHQDVAKELADRLLAHMNEWAPLTAGNLDPLAVEGEAGAGRMSFDALPGLE